MTILSVTPWCQQSSFNTTQSGDLASAFSAGASLPTGLHIGGAVFIKNKVYLFCSTQGAAAVPTYNTTYVYNYVIEGDVDSSGVITSFSASAMTMEKIAMKVFAMGAKVRMAGGINSQTDSYYSSGSASSELNDDGTISEFGIGWGGGTVGGVHLGGHVFINNGTLCCITPGYNFYSRPYPDTGVTCDTYGLVVDADGDFVFGVYPALELSGWSSLLYKRVSNSCLVKTSSRVYLIGGRTGASTCCGTVQSAPLNGDGSVGTWINESGLVLPSSKVLWGGNAVVTKDAFYILGGWDGITGSTNTSIFYGAINSSGVITSISTSSRTLSASRLNAPVIVTSSRLYILGGFSSGSSVLSSTEYVSFTGGKNDYRLEIGYPVPTEADGVVSQDEAISFGYGQSGDVLGYIEQECPTSSGVASNPIQCYGVVEQSLIDGAGYGNAFLRGTGVVEQELSTQEGIAHIILLANGVVEQGESIATGVLLNGVGGVGRIEQGELSAAGLATYPTVGFGEAVQLFPQENGTATIGPYPAYGDIEQGESVSFGTVIFGNIGDGSVEQGVSTQVGYSVYPTVGFGVIEQAEAVLSSSADMFQVGFGRIEQEIPDHVAIAESLYTDQGSIEQDVPGVSAYATITVVGLGDVVQEPIEIVAVGEMPCIGFGDIYSEVPDIAATAYIIGLGFGNIYQDVPESSAIGVVPTVGYGNVIQIVPKVSTYSDLRDVNLHLVFSRCTGVPPILSYQDVLIPQEFNRCDPGMVGTTPPANVPDPFHFLRCL